MLTSDSEQEQPPLVHPLCLLLSKKTSFCSQCPHSCGTLGKSPGSHLEMTLQGQLQGGSPGRRFGSLGTVSSCRCSHDALGWQLMLKLRGVASPTKSQSRGNGLSVQVCGHLEAVSDSDLEVGVWFQISAQASVRATCGTPEQSLGFIHIF